MIVCAHVRTSTRCQNAETHLILQILADGNAIAQTLPSPRLQHQIPRQSLSRGRLKRSQLDTRVCRISWNNAPVVESHLAERLAKGRRSEVRLEPVRIEYRDERFDSVQRRTGFRDISGHVATPP